MLDGGSQQWRKKYVILVRNSPFYIIAFILAPRKEIDYIITKSISWQTVYEIYYPGLFVYVGEERQDGACVRAVVWCHLDFKLRSAELMS